MPKHPTLSNPPIQEAIIEFRVKLDPEFDVAKFAQAEEKIDYPHKEERKLFKGEFLMSGKQKRKSPPKLFSVHGFWYKSQDMTQIAQFRIDGFTFNKLKPYSNWKDLSTETQRLWQIYKEITEPESVIRISARYINHISIEQGILDLSRYLTAAPAIPPGVPQTYTRFLNQISLIDENTGVIANVTQAKPPSKNAIILDIETFKESGGGFDDKAYWDVLEDLRNLKNDIFFNSLTPETLKRYE